jgi:branched-chain amino acid transport system substrate-binding protein
MRALLISLADEGTQAIFFTLTGPQASIFLNQARNDSGMDNATLISPDYLFDQNFAESTGFAANNLYLTGQYLNTDTQEMQAFLEKWRAKYGDQPVTSFYAQSYDAAHLLLNAIETIAMQDQSGRMLIGRQALRNALYSTRDFRGLTGTLACTPNGDCGSAQTLAVYTVVYELLDPEAGFTLSWPPHMYWLP